MDKFSDLLVDKSLHGLRDAIWPSITYSLVELAIDSVMSFLLLMVVQNIRKTRISVWTRVTGHSVSLFKMADSL